MSKRVRFLALVVKNAAPWAGGVVSGTLNLLAILVLLGLAAFSDPPRALVVVYLAAVVFIALGEGAYRTWSRTDQDLKVATRKLEAEHLREAVIDRLEGMAHEMELMQRELDDLSPDDFDSAERRSITHDMNHIISRVNSELRSNAPQFLAYWKSEPADWDKGVKNIPDGQRLWVKYSIEQVRHIADELKKGPNGP